MRYELRKMFGDRRLCLLLLCIVLGNAFLFYEHCTDGSRGYTMAQVQKAYQMGTADTLRERQEELRERLAQSGEREDDALLTGDVYDEYMLTRAVLERMEQTEGYEEYRQELVGDALVKLKLGLLGDSESFSGRSLARGAKEYEALSQVTPETSFSGGVELLAEWHITDGFLLLFGLAAGLFLLTLEKGIGVNKLTRPTRYGHARLYLRKFGAMALLVSAGFLVLYGTNGLIAGGLFGYGNLGRAVQSVYGYNGCPMRLSVGGFLLRLFLFKYLWALACAALLFFLCTLTDTAGAAVLLTALAAVLAFLLGGSRLWWLRCVSLSRLACAEELFQGAIYLNLFGSPIERLPAAALFVALVLAASLGGGTAVCCMTPGAFGSVRRFVLGGHSVHTHTRLFGHELHKLFSMSRGAAVLLLLLAVQLLSYKDFYVNRSEYEYYYRNYSRILEGEPSEEKDAYLADERERIASLSRQMEEYAKRYGEGVSMVSAAREVQEQLAAQAPFESACRQYESLTKGQSYLYQTGYERLLNAEGRRDDWMNMAKYFLALVLVLSAAFAVEGETGVEVLQRTAGRERAVLGRKLLLSVCYVALTEVIAFLPQYIAVFGGYGGLELSAQANSVALLAKLSPGWSVGGVFAVTALIRLLLVGAVGAVTAVLAAKTRNTVMALMISLAMALAPVGVALYLCG